MPPKKNEASKKTAQKQAVSPSESPESVFNREIKKKTLSCMGLRQVSAKKKSLETTPWCWDSYPLFLPRPTLLFIYRFTCFYLMVFTLSIPVSLHPFAYLFIRSTVVFFLYSLSLSLGKSGGG